MVNFHKAIESTCLAASSQSSPLRVSYPTTCAQADKPCTPMKSPFGVLLSKAALKPFALAAGPNVTLPERNWISAVALLKK
ncbi:hypothetical protein HBH56_217170 [Parastagonospora nodorum]|nr:hypothetical protein HBH56_217170 [Parastagonospora nodorum]KAH3922746.1 hypothetical protein HBH54_219030 [Parastagonospora nodorum]KAH3956335.1 hypothetical protein HBH51_244330 [Parastagonospora nodorum]KAH3961513.1 hypothetical protein HBH52_229880 [Parastagonospora nodorum]KAH4009754.1 hypothetical protein HBI13_214520 [Parastagonospora nodorum]